MTENLKQIFINLPLVLSDTRDPADVSLNRVMTAAVAFFVLLAPGVTLLLLPAWFDKITPYWDKLLAFLAAQVAGNMFKKYVAEVKANAANQGN